MGLSAPFFMDGGEGGRSCASCARGICTSLYIRIIQVARLRRWSNRPIDYRGLESIITIQRKRGARPLCHWMAEREGFEPSIRDYRIHTFQACSFNHSDTSPNSCLFDTVLEYTGRDDSGLRPSPLRGRRLTAAFSAIAPCIALPPASLQSCAAAPLVEPGYPNIEVSNPSSQFIKERAVGPFPYGWRRGRDSNPRRAVKPSTDFESVPL